MVDNVPKRATEVTYKWAETDSDCACGWLGAGCEELSWPCVNEFRDSAYNWRTVLRCCGSQRPQIPEDARRRTKQRTRIAERPRPRHGASRLPLETSNWIASIHCPSMSQSSGLFRSKHYFLIFPMDDHYPQELRVPSSELWSRQTCMIFMKFGMNVTAYWPHHPAMSGMCVTTADVNCQIFIKFHRHITQQITLVPLNTTLQITPVPLKTTLQITPVPLKTTLHITPVPLNTTLQITPVPLNTTSEMLFVSQQFQTWRRLKRWGCADKSVTLTTDNLQGSKGLLIKIKFYTITVNTAK